MAVKVGWIWQNSVSVDYPTRLAYGCIAVAFLVAQYHIENKNYDHVQRAKF